MKKVLLILMLATLFISCEDKTTTVSQDIQMLQKKYKTTIVYKIVGDRHIVCDSTHVYDVIVSNDGQITSSIVIK
jgi:hypothetical protein